MVKCEVSVGTFFFLGNGSYTSVFGGSSFECGCYVQELLLEGLILCTVKYLNTKRRQLYLKTQFVPRSKHFSSRL